MNEKALRELDAWMPTVTKSDVGAARNMAEIVGVLIGVKTVAMDLFLPEELQKVDLKWFRGKLHELGLHVIFERRALGGNDPMNYAEYYYLGKDHETALVAQNLFHKIWSGEWEMNREIGALLGYPQTAVEYFLNKKGKTSKEDQKRMARNRFYIHSPEHEDDEFDAYERKIYAVLGQFCPKTMEVLKQSPEKRMV